MLISDFLSLNDGNDEKEENKNEILTILKNRKSATHRQRKQQQQQQQKSKSSRSRSKSKSRSNSPMGGRSHSDSSASPPPFEDHHNNSQQLLTDMESTDNLMTIGSVTADPVSS